MSENIERAQVSLEKKDFIPARTEVVREIYTKPLSTAESKIVQEKAEFYESADEEVYNHIEKLREETGTIEGWRETKEKARSELKEVPTDVLE